MNKTINYYNHGMLEYTFRKELISYLVKNNLPIRNLKQLGKYKYCLYNKGNHWTSKYLFNGKDFNNRQHPRSMDVRIAYLKS